MEWPVVGWSGLEWIGVAWSGLERNSIKPLTLSQTSLIIKELIKLENKFNRNVFHDRVFHDFQNFHILSKGFKKYIWTFLGSLHDEGTIVKYVFREMPWKKHFTVYLCLYICPSAIPVATKLGRVVTFGRRTPPLKSHDLLIMRSRGKWKKLISTLLQYLWPSDLCRVVTYRWKIPHTESGDFLIK